MLDKLRKRPTFVAELSTMDHASHRITDFQIVGVGAEGGDMGNGTREITSDDGTRNRKTGDGGVLPVCKMK
jgi:hypothetical protein